MICAQWPARSQPTVAAVCIHASVPYISCSTLRYETIGALCDLFLLNLEGCLWRITPWAKKIAQRVGCWVLCESLSSDQSGNKDQFQRVHFDQIFALRRTNWTRCAIEQILHRCRRMFIWKNKVVGAVCSHQISCLFKRFLIYEQWICEMRRIEIVALWG